MTGKEVIEEFQIIYELVDEEIDRLTDLRGRIKSYINYTKREQDI